MAIAKAACRTLLIGALVAAVAGSGPRAASARDFVERMSHGGHERTYLVHVPERARLGPLPLLFVLHGGGGTAAGMIRLSHGAFDQLADIYGAIVVYPQGYENHWNDGRALPDQASRLAMDDVGFIRRIIETLSSRFPVDRERIYSCGISNGGQMSFRLAIDLSSHIRGIATVAMNLGRHQLARPPARPVSLLMIPGTADPLVPFSGGEIVVFGVERGQVISAVDSLTTWAGWMGCPPRRSSRFLPDLDRADGTLTLRTVHAPGRAGARVEMLTVGNGGHTWPGGLQYLPRSIIGRTARDFDAAWAIWEFFGLNYLRR